MYIRVLLQEKNTKNKIYSLHEIDAYAVNKGKDHKGYEYGTKASVVTTKIQELLLEFLHIEKMNMIVKL